MFTLKVLLTIIRLWQLCYKSLDSECCLWIYEEIVEVITFYRKRYLEFTVEVITFYRKGYLEFTAQKIGNKALWYATLLDYNVGQQDTRKQKIF